MRGGLGAAVQAVAALAVAFAGLAACSWLALAPHSAHALTVRDDRGVAVELPAGPARRIISLAPHITELLFAAGAGDRVVGTVAFSNYPAAAAKLPLVGDVNALDLERIVALAPDLVIVWQQGSPRAQLDVLTALGLPIYYNEPRSLDAIGDALERFGTLAGSEPVAREAARAYRTRLAALRERYRGRAPVTVFHQIWEEPLLTLNAESLLGQMLQLCGGRNVFGALPALVPQVSVEAVLDADPEVIGTAASTGPRQALASWLAWPQLRAVAQHNLYAIDPDLLTRHSPRILDGAEQLCGALEAARARRAAAALTPAPAARRP